MKKENCQQTFETNPEKIEFNLQVKELCPEILNGFSAFRKLIELFEQNTPEGSFTNYLLDQYSDSLKITKFIETVHEKSLRFLDIYDPNLPPVTLLDLLKNDTIKKTIKPEKKTRWQRIKQFFRMATWGVRPEIRTNIDTNYKL